MTNTNSEKKKGPRDPRLDARRESVKKILGAGGIVAGAHLAPDSWLKPVVESVVLPAHAVTSGERSIRFDDSLGDPCFITVTCTGYQNIQVTVTGAVLPPTANVNVAIEISLNGGSYSPFAGGSTTTDGTGSYQASETFSTTGYYSIDVRTTLPDYPEAGTAECSVTASEDGSEPGGGYYTYPGDTYFCQQDTPPPS